MTNLISALPMLLALLLATACAPSPRPQADPWQALRLPDGSVLWLDEYRFAPPPQSWQVLDLNDRDFSLALYKTCEAVLPEEFPCESTMAYAEEPFGHSRELEPRAREFLKRYLWASMVEFSTPEMRPTRINGRDALTVLVTGMEPVKHFRLQAKIVLMHRGERVVAFFINQWRAGDRPFNEEDFIEFDRFVASFQFAKPSFYETL